MPLNFLAALAISLAISVVSAVIQLLVAPKPKAPQPEAARDLEEPTAEAGRPVQIIWGTVTVKGPNVLWFGEKSNKQYRVKV